LESFRRSWCSKSLQIKLFPPPSQTPVLESFRRSWCSKSLQIKLFSSFPNSGFGKVSAVLGVPKVCEFPPPSQTPV